MITSAIRTSTKYCRVPNEMKYICILAHFKVKISSVSVNWRRLKDLWIPKTIGLSGLWCTYLSSCIQMLTDIRNRYYWVLTSSHQKRFNCVTCAFAAKMYQHGGSTGTRWIPVKGVRFSTSIHPYYLLLVSCRYEGPKHHVGGFTFTAAGPRAPFIVRANLKSRNYLM